MEIIYGNILAESIKSSMKQKIDDIRAQKKITFIKCSSCRK